MNRSVTRFMMVYDISILRLLFSNDCKKNQVSFQTLFNYSDIDNVMPRVFIGFN